MSQERTGTKGWRGTCAQEAAAASVDASNGKSARAAFEGGGKEIAAMSSGDGTRTRVGVDDESTQRTIRSKARKL
jgi:hypothetical protein